MHVFIYAFVWKKEKLHKNSFTTFISEVINIDFGIFGILTLRVLGGCVCNLASFWRKLWEDSICEWPLSWEMANFSINWWYQSFVIISNSVFSVLWTFREKFLSTNGDPVHSQGKVELSSKNPCTSRVFLNLLKLEILDPVAFVKI